MIIITRPLELYKKKGTRGVGEKYPGPLSMVIKVASVNRGIRFPFPKDSP